MDFQNYKQVLDYCSRNKIQYVLLRYPHILPREIHDLDLLIGKKEDYYRLLKYLQSEKFICLEKESFRSFWAKKAGKELVVLDVYNRISWLGWTLLDKNQVLHRKKKFRGVMVCSDEDELLVYLAQALFKNNGLNAYKTAVIRTLMKKKLNWNYLIQQMKRHRWIVPGKKLLAVVRKSKNESILRSKIDFVDTLLAALTLRRAGILISRLSNFIFTKNWHTATTICLLGPDGSGKSTLAKNLKPGYEHFFQKFTPKIKIVYFGWKPFLPTTKLLSLLFKKRRYNIVEKTNEKSYVNTKKKSSTLPLFQSLLFGYFFLEYLARYSRIIFPQRKEKKIIIIDRYFYDIYAHYHNAGKSRLFFFLLKLFPHPDYTFLLDVPVERLWQRKQEISKEKLQQHQKKYRRLGKVIPVYRLDTTQNIGSCQDEIISKTWRKISRRIK